MAGLTVHLVAAARPNFMKIAPLLDALSREAWCRPVLIHTGQHFDAAMSADMFADLGLKQPDHHLGVAGGSHGAHTGGVMIAYEKLCLAEPPDWVVVVGDVNSTLAAALVAAKLHLPIAHLEAGLRSRDRSMPEETNRLLTDQLSSLLWTPSADADDNLLAEGIDANRIVRVGNIMIDALERQRPKIEADGTVDKLGLAGRDFGVVTLHRPPNVDDRKALADLVQRLVAISRRLTLVFPVHPRTRARLDEFGLMPHLDGAANLIKTDPLPYTAFMSLVMRARLAITDSGGIQEETTYLRIPCLTLRTTTERPITVTQGSNRLIAPDALQEAVDTVICGCHKHGRVPELWDGRTAARVVASLREAAGV